MFEYYLAGRRPTKQALLALAICLELSPGEMGRLLGAYGYCLSKSLPNDAVVRWFLENTGSGSRSLLLDSINEVLSDLDLPLLMTKNYKNSR